MAKEITPLMQQYYDMKSKYPDTLMLFRMGDFFECFDDDAGILSKVCGIALTKRNNGAAEASPLAGFPHHQLDSYLPKLVKAGLRVAVCEQIEDPKVKAGKIVKREVIEVVTPGVSLYDKLLESSRNNFICSVYLQKNKGIVSFVGMSICDITTGEFLVAEVRIEQILQVLEQYNPTEIIFSKSQSKEVENILSQTPLKLSHTKLEEWVFEQTFSRELLLRQFQTTSFKGFGIESLGVGISAAGVILHYVSETQKQTLPQIQSIRSLNISDRMLLDYSTRRNLEILQNMEGEANGSLIKLLDKTLTPPGARLLRKWLNQPLNNLDAIHKRLDAVECLVENGTMLKKIVSILHNFGDLERLISRIASGKATTRDVVNLSHSLDKIPQIKNIFDIKDNIENFKDAICKIVDNIIPLNNLVNTIQDAMLDEPSTQFGTGNIFRQGYNEELALYVQAKYSAKEWLNKFQEAERYRTNIPTLKVGFNNVFGYYIEITKAHSSKAPENYERKQTLTTAERYTIPELKEFEDKILNAEFKIHEIEQRLFNEIKSKILEYIEQIQHNAYHLAVLDCIQSFATISKLNNYVKPEIDDSLILNIKNGRHPVVEKLLPPNEKFVSNSTFIDTDTEQIQIITGPNMAGKSCYLRQTALIVLMGQIGCFVPANKAHFGLVDRIFTRVGAQDNIGAGESTFLVEMQETAYILNNATKRSLILLDEVGRGTATFDGISIAWAITEYLHEHIQAKTLFATHYHELNDLSVKYDRIANYRADVLETSNNVIFTHKFVKGASDHSFGIYVGKMAGLPYSVVQRASEIMEELEKDIDNSNANKLFADTSKIPIKKKPIKQDNHQLSIFEFKDDEIRNKLRDVDLYIMTPIQALQYLQELKNML